jgi:hypothetical protein
VRDSSFTTRSRWLRGWHARSALIALILVLTLAVAAALAYQAQRAARSHRAMAENVLRDYAALASSELTRLARRELSEVLRAQLIRLASTCDGRDRLPDLEQWVLVKDN